MDIFSFKYSIKSIIGTYDIINNSYNLLINKKKL